MWAKLVFTQLMDHLPWKTFGSSNVTAALDELEFDYVGPHAGSAIIFS